LCSFPCIAQNCRNILTGHIQDADTKEELAGATILLQEVNKTFVTDNNGDFRYNGLCSGTYTLQITHAGCAPLTKSISIGSNLHLDLSMPHLRNNLAEVIIEGEKTPPTTGFKEQLDKKVLEASKGYNIAEALSHINGVNMLQTGSTVSKPVIHGLHSTRILTINNGVRQEGQQWGNEHAPEIDTYIADKLSVIKGVDELKYGSDAIGGVILVDPKPIRAIPGYNAEINTGYFTNNGEYVASGIYEQQLKRPDALSYRIQGTYKRAGNVMTSDYRLNNTGIEEQNFSAGANWKKDHYQIQTFFSQFFTRIGIFTGSHIGNQSDLLKKISLNKPDDVFLGDKTYIIKRPKQEVVHRLFKLKGTADHNGHKFGLTLAGQYNHRDEYDVIRSTTNPNPQVKLAITTFSEEFTYEHPVTSGFRGTAGVSLMQQDNSYSGRYLIPAYFSSGYGAYLIEKWSAGKLDLEGGIRYDFKGIDTKRLKYGGTEVDHYFKFGTLASSFNAGYRITGDLKINADISLSSRAPHVNELLIDGIHEGAGIYEQGDINLKPEHSANISGGLVYNAKPLTIELNLYTNRISNFIFQRPVADSPVATIVGAFPLWRYEQTNARLQGIDFSAALEVFRSFQLSSKVSILRARNLAIDDWLILMPADRWTNGITYTLKNGKKISDAYISAELVSVFKARTPDPSHGQLDYKEAPAPYTLVNFDASATLHVSHFPFTVGIGARNLLNKSYRDYMNSFRYYTDEMGRNISFRLKIPFENFFSKRMS
jgi:iron complex outermembrane recepter protein